MKNVMILASLFLVSNAYSTDLKKLPVEVFVVEGASITLYEVQYLLQGANRMLGSANVRLKVSGFHYLKRDEARTEEGMLAFGKAQDSVRVYLSHKRGGMTSKVVRPKDGPAALFLSARFDRPLNVQRTSTQRTVRGAFGTGLIKILSGGEVSRRPASIGEIEKVRKSSYLK